jgi:K+/H+ antiporter YhaU regulatory subunit KhtT
MPHSLQVTLKKSSDLVKKTIKDAGFRGRFNAAVIAVKRHRKVQQGRLGDITLQPRDVIVLSVNDKFDPSIADFNQNFER